MPQAVLVAQQEDTQIRLHKLNAKHVLADITAQAEVIRPLVLQVNTQHTQEMHLVKIVQLVHILEAVVHVVAQIALAIIISQAQDKPVADIAIEGIVEATIQQVVHHLVARVDLVEAVAEAMKDVMRVHVVLVAIMQAAKAVLVEDVAHVTAALQHVVVPVALQK